MKLPFWIIPAHWGLSGKSKELARIDYYIKEPREAEEARARLIDDPVEMSKSLLRIQHKYHTITDASYEFSMFKLDNEFATEIVLEKKKLEIDWKYNLISEKEYLEGIIEYMPDGKEKDIRTLDFLLKYREITEDNYKKQIATLNQKVWWKLSIESTDDGTADIELDYNEYFVKFLQETGHPGNDEGEIVDFYVKDLGRKLATGDLNEDEDVKLIKANMIHGTTDEDGIVTYS